MSLACLLFLGGVALTAQPSGGPYGPIQQTYELPSDAGAIYYVAPDGVPGASGASVEEPTTIESAIERVVTGDAVILRGGTYRTGNLMLNQGITLQPYQDERPVLKGTRVVEEWEPVRGGLWRVKWDTLFPAGPQSWWRRERESARTPLYLFNNDMVFVEGEPLRMVGWAGEVEADSYAIDYEDGYVYLGVNPENMLVEITAFDNALTRVIGEVHGKSSDKIGPTIRGLAFTQYAYRAIEIEGKDPEGVSPESEHGKDVVGTTLEHCSITHCSRVGGYFRGDDLTIRNCLVSDTSTEGIFILASNDVLLERNLFRRNNVEGITGYFPAAVKIFNQCYRVVCRDNLVTEQSGSSGIWYDVGNVDGVFVNNWIENSNDGFFFEISKGAICAGNVFLDCNKGIRILNSSDVRVYQNTFVNSMASFERTERSAEGDHFGWHPASGPGVDERDGHVFVGNLLAADGSFEGAMLNFEQREVLKERLREPQVTALDFNVFARQGIAGVEPLIAWSPVAGDGNFIELFSTIELNQVHPDFAKNSPAYLEYYGPLFKGWDLKRFELLSGFPASVSDVPLPEPVLDLLGWTSDFANFPGAYPVVE